MPDYVITIFGPAADADALGVAAAELGDPRVSAVALAPSDESDETLVRVFAAGPTQRGAINEARAVYQALRTHAGLIEATGYETAITARMDPIRHFRPKATSSSRSPSKCLLNNYLHAVISIQTAFEVYMEGVFAFALDLRTPSEVGDAVAQLLRGKYNLRDDRVRDLWESLSGQRVKASPSWNAYAEHLDRRNRLVHRGESVSRDQASASLVAVQDLTTQVSSAVRGLVPRPKQSRESG